jgi:hypothetical protein
MVSFCVNDSGAGVARASGFRTSLSYIPEADERLQFYLRVTLFGQNARRIGENCSEQAVRAGEVVKSQASRLLAQLRHGPLAMGRGQGPSIGTIRPGAGCGN